MYKKIIFGYSDFDEETMYQTTPNGFSSLNHYAKNSNHPDTFGDKWKDLINHCYGSRKDLFSFKNINNIKNDEKYIYPISSYSMQKNENNEYYYTIPKKVLDDIKEKRCVILFERFWEIDGHHRYIPGVNKNNNIAPDQLGIILHKNYENIPYSSIFFVNPNLNIKRCESVHPVFTFSFFETLLENSSEDEINEIKNNILNKQIREYKFCCLNRHAKFHRVWLAYLLFDIANNSDVIYTFNVFTKESKNNVLNALNDCQLKKDNIKVRKLINSLPWIYDNNNRGEDINDLTARCDVHRKAYINVVTESFYQDRNDAIFFSEKIYKPIKMMQPFILVGASHSLKKLREIGYETFPEIIDESYDKIENVKERVYFISNEIRRLYSKSKEELSNMLYSIVDKLEHNAITFKNHSMNNNANIFYNTLQKEIYNNWPK